MTEKIKADQTDLPSLSLLEKLCNATAVSGDEYEVRQIVLEEIKPFADELKVDALGNILAVRKAKTANPVRLMIAAHMDEIGMMIVAGDDDGLYEFALVGGIDERQLPGKAVLVGRDHMPGVIGAKPIHFTTAQERENKISLDGMRIDVGPEGKGKVKIGDRATFATRFEILGPSVKAKALDDRLGVAALIELLKNAPENVELLAAFTVQEEVGLRGAGVAAFAFEPDAAIVLDCTPANDLPCWDDEDENYRYNTRLDGGPAIYLMDSSAIHAPHLAAWLSQIADEAGIPWQYRQPGAGGTDAGAIHKTKGGIPSVSVSVPGRYIHTAAGIVRMDDWQHTYKLIHLALTKITPQIIAQK